MTPNVSSLDTEQKKPEMKECDLVMKGGLTSGIVYPPLVNKLHEHGYSFRNIGGTSAGAIAAAITAAAEHGKDQGGFEKLNKVRDWLGKDDNLKRLFQPSWKTAPLMNTLFGYSEMKSLKWPPLRLLAAFIRYDLLVFALGTLIGVLLAVLFAVLVSETTDGALRGRGLVVLVIFGLLGGLLAGAWHLYDILKNVVPANGFGLCNGRGKDLQNVDDKVLTDWLHVQLNDLAGRKKPAEDAPLTFGELWGPNDPTPEKRRIDLRMMTSNLSQNQPYVLPFEREPFIFNEAEMLRLLPPKVVTHLKDHAHRHRGVLLPEGYCFLPPARNLPVILAARMSLSFPVLISMVPLYTISQKAFKSKSRVRCEIVEAPRADNGTAKHEGKVIQFYEERAGEGWVELSEEQPCKLDKPDDLQRNWFSDGGICSNFPVHFFDAWLPSRPTFGVNLTSQLAKGVEQRGGGQATVEDLIKKRSVVPVVVDKFEDKLKLRPGTRVQMRGSYAEDVYLPRPDEILPPEWMPIDGLGKFLETIFRTAQNYRDNMQAMLPSYRERIVQIRLTDQEGGLNLDMDRKTIQRVVDKGEKAAAKLIDHFKLPKHQWVRFLVLMKQMEQSLNKMNEVMTNQEFYMGTLATPPLSEDFPYHRNDQWLKDAHERLKKLGGLIKEFNQLMPPELFVEDAPLPEPVLRVTPRI